MCSSGRLLTVVSALTPLSHMTGCTPSVRLSAQARIKPLRDLLDSDSPTARRTRVTSVTGRRIGVLVAVAFLVGAALVAGLLWLRATESDGEAMPAFSIEELGPLTDCGADPTAVRVDGGTRVYFIDGGIECSDSGSQSDSLLLSDEVDTPVADVGRRFNFGGNVGPHRRIFELPDGGYRMFFSTSIDSPQNGIGSAFSTDGLTFTEEQGLRISIEQAGVDPRPALSVGEIVPTADGRYRMYFSSMAFEERDPEQDVEVIKSAVSSDLLTWEVEPGNRIGGDAPLSGSGEHPAAITNPDGSVTLFYGRPSNEWGLYASTSLDGLNFTKEEFLMPRVLDSSFVLQPDGTIIGFVGRRNMETDTSFIDRIQLTPHTG